MKEDVNGFAILMSFVTSFLFVVVVLLRLFFYKYRTQLMESTEDSVTIIFVIAIFIQSFFI